MFFARSMFSDLGLEKDAEDKYKGSRKNPICSYNRGKRSGSTSSLRRFLQKLKVLRIMNETFGLISKLYSMLIEGEYIGFFEYRESHNSSRTHIEI